jgi:uncharacterized repeat protein (TIGR01451 family)
LDDDPSGTPYDDYAVSLTVTDDDTGATTAATTVRVYNVNPSVSVTASGPISENSSTTLTGTISDPGTLDTFDVAISWGDGSSETLSLSAGSTSFSASHTYVDDDPSGTPWDSYTISVTVTDDDTGVGSGSTLVTVENVDPSLGELSATSPIVEGGTTTLTGTWTDPSPADTFTLVVDWGDGASDTYNYAAGTTSFSETHRYLDDDPTGTPSDGYTISVTLSDDDTGSDSASATVVVDNVAPTLSSLTLSAGVGENGIATLGGTISDPGTLDTFEVTVDWGDGTTDTFSYPAGVVAFSETHRYLDDDPSGTPFDPYTVSVTVRDDDTGTSATRTANITVYNAAPGVADLVVTSPIDEGGSTTLSGTIVDAGTQDSISLFIDWGDGTSGFYPYNVQTRTFSLTHQYLDDDPSTTPSDTYNIDIIVTDDDTGTSTTPTSVVVNNVAPALGDILVTGPIDEDGTATVSGTISDPGTLDTFTLVVDWGDGTSDTYTYGAGTSSFSETHQYLDDDPTGTASDEYTIGLSLSDDDTGDATATTTVTVQNVDPADLVLTLSDASIDEGDTVTLSGSFSDVGSKDTHKVVIDWRDGSPNTTIDLAVGVLTFTADHQYLDDDPTATPSDTYPVTVTVADDDTGSTTATIELTVNNVDPIIGDIPTSFSIDEGGCVTLEGTVIDPGSKDTHVVRIEWAPLWDPDHAVLIYNIPAGEVAFSAVECYPDDGLAPGNGTISDTYNVKLTVTDDDNGSSQSDVSVRVHNTMPVLTGLAATTPVDASHTSTLTGNITDPGKKDAFTLTVDWGDGSPTSTYNYPAGTTSFSEEHQFVPSTSQGSFTITATLSDDDSESDTRTTTVTLQADVSVTMTATDTTEPINDGIVCCGDDIIYSIIVSNSGTSAATTVTLVDTLPLEVETPSPSNIVPSHGTCAAPSGTNLTCTLGTLLPGDSATIKVQVTVKKGTKGDLTNHANATSDVYDPNPSNNTKQVTTTSVLVTSVEWIAIASPLVENDHPIYGGGDAIFPDRVSPTDSTPRNRLRLQAQLEPAKPNIRIYFRSFDVDDPSPSPIIDPTGDAGNDNLGEPRAGQFTTSAADRASAVTNQYGRATMDFFEVTMQPGDNFRVAAACSDKYVYDKLQVDNPSAAWYVPAGNGAVDGFSGDYGAVTGMLTVWRRLWIEGDSMRAMPTGANVVSGNVVNVTGPDANGHYMIETDVSLNSAEGDRFVPGSLTDRSGGVWNVAANSGGNLIVWVHPKPPATPGDLPPVPATGTFTLVDDDDNSAFASPRFDLLTTDVLSAFKPAYIKAIDASAYNATPLVDFKLNAAISDSVFDTGKDLVDAPDFWTHRVISAFQGMYDVDGDWNEEAHLFGVTISSRSVIYLETIRDWVGGRGAGNLGNLSLAVSLTVTHEIAHCPGGQSGDQDHAEGGIQGNNDPASSTLSGSIGVFDDLTVRRFRKTTKWCS